MSKSALFAGLGQGLMSLGQNVGEAYRMKAIEELRQENLQQNWARQDAMRERDIAREDKLRAENFAREDNIRAQNYAREDAKTVTNTSIETRDDGSKFKIGKNAAGDQVTSEQMESKPQVVQTRIKNTETGEKFIESYDQNGNLVSSEQKDTSPNQGQTTTHQHLINMGYQPNTPEYKEAYSVLSGFGEKSQVESIGKPKNVEQSKAEGFYDRMVHAQQEIDSLGDYDSTATWEKIRAVTNTTASPEYQRYQQAADDWIRAKLRKESGAVIGEEEMAAEYRNYFPQFGDSQEVIEQKRRARKVAENAMYKSAGNVGDSYINRDSGGLSAQGTVTPQAPQAALQALEQNPSLAEQFRAKYGYLPQGF